MFFIQNLLNIFLYPLKYQYSILNKKHIRDSSLIFRCLEAARLSLPINYYKLQKNVPEKLIVQYSILIHGNVQKNFLYSNFEEKIFRFPLKIKS